MNDLEKRIRQSATRFMDRCVGMRGPSGDELPQLNVEFDPSPSDSVSKMLRDGSRLILYTSAIASLLPDADAVTNSVVDVLVGWITLREMWWNFKGVDEHSTTLEHMNSPEAGAAFLKGYSEGAK